MSTSFEKPIVYKNFKGINNLEHSYRLQIVEDGIALKDAVNVCIDRTGAIESREGTNLIWSHETNDLWSSGRDMLGVVDGVLSIIYPFAGWAYDPLISSNNLPWYYTTAGFRYYASDGKVIGYVENSTWNSFVTPTQKYKRSFPPCKHLEYWNGRLYGAIGGVGIFSDPMWLEVIDERNDKAFLQYADEIVMWRGVNDGMWVGTKEALYFLEGLSPNEFKSIQRTDYGMIEGTDRILTNTMVKGEIWPNAIWVTTDKGIAVLGDGGKIMNDMEVSYAMPSVSRGTAYIRRGRINQYVSIVK